MERQHFFIVYLFLQTLSFLLLLQEGFQPVFVLFFLLSIIFIAPTLMIEGGKGKGVTLVCFYLLSLFVPEVGYFLPAAWWMINRYNLMPIGWKILGITVIFAFECSLIVKCLLVLLILLVNYLSYLKIKYQQMSHQLLELQDDSWEKESILHRKNEELQKSQEVLLNLEIAEERNRIARDIHDNVGHLLSSAIIQIGALEVMNQDEKLQRPLNQLKETVHTGMNRIRESVHDLHQTSLSFQRGLELLLEDFTFCPIEVSGDLSNELSIDEGRVFLTVIREALANVMKHSNANKVIIEQSTLPAFYRCRISDNGRKKESRDKGIGLLSMQQRMTEIGGQLHISQGNNGFVVTMILPKNSGKP